MTRTPLLAVAALTLLGACATTTMTGRADNDMLRFSAMDYTRVSESAQ